MDNISYVQSLWLRMDLVIAEITKVYLVFFWPDSSPVELTCVFEVANIFALVFFGFLTSLFPLFPLFFPINHSPLAGHSIGRFIIRTYLW